MKRFSLFFLIVFAASISLGCSRNDSTIPEWPWDDPEKEEPEKVDPQPILPETDQKWLDISAGYDQLPEYIRIWKSPDELEGKKALAFIADADLSKAKVDLWSIDVPEMQGTNEKLRTPADIWEKEKCPVIINAGFFYSSDGKNYSASLAIRNSEYMAYNVNYASEDWIKVYYPTRAAFLKNKNGEYKACWTYYNNNDKKNYIYREPAHNKWGEAPQPVPTADFPVEAENMEVVWGIGGGPVLIVDGNIKNTFEEELFNGDTGILPDSNHPRTAVGITPENHLLFFVCEGRNAQDGIPGLTTGDVAKILKEKGCTEAINLDGGGSTCMLVNGQETVKPSDGSERYVASILMMK